MKEEDKVINMPISEIRRIFYEKADLLTSTVLWYYVRLAKEKPPPKLPTWILKENAIYFGATVSCELRHINSRCCSIIEGGESVALFAMENFVPYRECDSSVARLKCGAKFIDHINDYFEFDVDIIDYIIWYLKQSSLIFGGEWKGDYGGRNWASCCIHACNWLEESTRNGNFALTSSWEKWINACHNNGRWLSKLGKYNRLFKAMELGAENEPSEIIRVASEYFQGNYCSIDNLASGRSPREASKIIEFDGASTIDMNDIREMFGSEPKYFYDEEGGDYEEEGGDYEEESPYIVDDFNEILKSIDESEEKNEEKEKKEDGKKEGLFDIEQLVFDFEKQTTSKRGEMLSL